MPSRSRRSRARGRSRRESDRRRCARTFFVVSRALPVRDPGIRDGMSLTRMLRATVAVAAVAASVLLTGATPTPTPTPPPVPDDPADPVRAAEYWLDGAGIRDAWHTTRGKGVTIAVIDTGIGKVPSVFADAVVGGIDVSGSGSPDGRTPVGTIDSDHG